MTEAEIRAWRRAITIARTCRETLTPRESTGARKMQAAIVRHLIEGSGLELMDVFEDVNPAPDRPIENKAPWDLINKRTGKPIAENKEPD